MMVGLVVAGYSLVDSQAMHRVTPLPYLAVMFLGSAFFLAPWAFRIQDSAPIRSAWGAGLSPFGDGWFWANVLRGGRHIGGAGSGLRKRVGYYFLNPSLRPRALRVAPPML